MAEAQVLAQFMDEPNIVGIKDYFLENNTAYIVMEYLEGQDLSHYLKANGPQSFEKVFEMLKPGFAPEEQYRTHGRQGPWTDVYALCHDLFSYYGHSS